ncbi:MAG: YncE family protein [Anaerolineae bacterium]
MQPIKTIELPPHAGSGGFDHAAVHLPTGQLFVAHTANNALDVIDCVSDRYLRSIPGLTGVAGALVAEEQGLLFTSNRGEDTVSILRVLDQRELARVKVGVRPNGLAYDSARGLLLAANVGNPDAPDSFTVSIVDVLHQVLLKSVRVAGRTRWVIFDPRSGSFHVNIADPYQIAVIESANPSRVSRSIPIPSKGPHGLDFDPVTNRLFCACDAGRLFALEAATGTILMEAALSGTPDVIFFNAARRHLYVAVGDPGVIDLFDTDTLRRVAVIPTGRGAHTLAFDAARNKVYAFLPETHAARVFVDAG